jgi:excisionase family DNA binding protein
LGVTGQLQLDLRSPGTAMAVAKRAGDEPAPLTVTVATALRMTQLGRTKLYELIGSGRIETVKIGRRRLIHLSSLYQLVSEQAAGTQGA